MLINKYLFNFSSPEIGETPFQRVQFLLGADDEKESHNVFSEMGELFYDEDGNVLEWKETARWEFNYILCGFKLAVASMHICADISRAWRNTKFLPVGLCLHKFTGYSIKRGISVRYRHSYLETKLSVIQSVQIAWREDSYSVSLFQFFI